MPKRRGRPSKIYKTEAEKALFGENFFDKHSKLVLKSIKALQPHLTDTQAKDLFISELTVHPRAFRSSAEAEHFARTTLAAYRGEDTDLIETLYEVRDQAKRLGVDLRGANLQSKLVEITPVTLYAGRGYAGANGNTEEMYFDVDSYYTIPTNPDYVIAKGIIYYLVGANEKKSPKEYSSIIPRSELYE